MSEARMVRPMDGQKLDTTPAPVKLALIDRSAAGLRDALFDQLDGMRNGRVSPNDAKAFAVVAQTIIKSIEVQIVFEAKRLASELPSTLGEMKLIPAIPSK